MLALNINIEILGICITYRPSFFSVITWFQPSNSKEPQHRVSFPRTPLLQSTMHHRWWRCWPVEPRLRWTRMLLYPSSSRLLSMAKNYSYQVTISSALSLTMLPVIALSTAVACLAMSKPTKKPLSSSALLLDLSRPTPTFGLKTSVFPNSTWTAESPK